MSTTATFQQGISGYTGTTDTYITSPPTDTVNHDADGALNLKWYAAENRSNTLVRFDVSSIPSGAIVVSATLTLVPSTLIFGAPFNVSSYPLKRNWIENQATWNIYSTGNNWETVGGLGANDIGSKEGTTAVPATGNAVFSIPVMVQGWIDGSLTNYGVSLITDGIAEKYWLGRDSEYATSASRPLLTVVCDYTAPPPSTRIRDVIGAGIIPYRR